jgi:hypothetical protein
MDLIQIAVTAALGLFSAFVAGYFLWCLSAALSGSLRAGRERWVLKNARESLERTDRFLAGQNYRDALREIRKAVLFKPFYRESSLSSLRAHYDNLLSRVLIIADRASPEQFDIARLERLLNERTELVALNVKAENAYRKLLLRREKSGKDIPSWSKEDFEKKSAEIRGELNRNGKELKEELQKFSEIISQPRPRDEIVYH